MIRCDTTAGSGGPPVRRGCPNVLLVADFTYVEFITGVFVYGVFVIDADAILGWEASASKRTRFVGSALRQAATPRVRQGHPVDGASYHSDAGPQLYECAVC